VTVTTAAPQANVALDDALNEMILEGRILEAFDRYYDDAVEMQESGALPTVGKLANRAREVALVENIGQFRARLLGSGASGDRSYSQWTIDLTFKNGDNVTMQQVAAREWRNGKVIRERFYADATPTQTGSDRVNRR
jgi:hypothetical protein